MSQLIALIIAIALGAIVTAIGFVFLGEAFTKNAERGVALQFVSQTSQIEMALTGYRTEKAASAWQTDLESTLTELTTEGHLKNVPIPPKGTYKAYKDDKAIYMVVDDLIASDGISATVCEAINKLLPLKMADYTDADNDNIPESLISDAPTAQAAIGTASYGCFEDAATATRYTYVYKAS